MPKLKPPAGADFWGADGTYGDGERAPGGVFGLEGPAVASESIAGSDIVKKIF